MYCERCGAVNNDADLACVSCGSALRPSTPVQNIAGDETMMGRLIPYKNVPALVSYYCAVFSIFPIAGIVLGLAAFVLGIAGLIIAHKNPERRGKVHAWIGIIGGAIFGFGQITLLIMIFASLFYTFK